jgi:ribose transport system ATP-binding protein
VGKETGEEDSGLSSKPLLTFDKISKKYPGVQALDQINFDIQKGEIHGIVGENGAGKSTLLKVLAGDITTYEGNIIIDGQKVSFKTPNEAIHAGISIVYQELNLCPNLTSVENVFLGREIIKNGRGAWDEMTKTTRNYLDLLKLNIDEKKPIKYFSIAQQQLIEIAKATAFNAKIIILDEPTSSLNQEEVKRLFDLLMEIRAKGETIIFVSHRLEEVFQIADRITVLREGKYIKTLKKEETDINEVVRLMIGRETIYEVVPRKIDRKEKSLEVTGLNRKGTFSDINFSLYKGEILGIAGLEGSGRYALVRSLFGLQRYDSGKIIVNGKEVRIKNPKDAIKSGIGFLSKDRKDEGIFEKMNLVKNISMVQVLDDKVFKNKKNEGTTQSFIEMLSIKCNSIKQNISSLSGGNQQKCIVSRWLAKNPQIIIMEEPTRGIDVGAKAEMFRIMQNLADNGKSIIFISTELEELIHECDKILVMQRGQLAGEVIGAKATKEEIMTLATGISA